MIITLVAHTVTTLQLCRKHISATSIKYISQDKTYKPKFYKTSKTTQDRIFCLRRSSKLLPLPKTVSDGVIFLMSKLLSEVHTQMHTTDKELREHSQGPKLVDNLSIVRGLSLRHPKRRILRSGDRDLSPVAAQEGLSLLWSRWAMHERGQATYVGSRDSVR